MYRELTLSPTTDVERTSALYHPSRLGKYVRSLSIFGFGEDSLRPLSSFLPLLARLHNINSLEFSLNWGCLGPDTRSFILQHFPPTVKELYISDTDFHNSNQTLRFLRSFSHLSVLAISNDITWQYPNHTRRQLSAQEPLKLDYLRIDDNVAHEAHPWATPTIQWLLAERRQFHVRNLHIAWTHTNVQPLVDLMEKLLPNLEKLDLRLNIREWSNCGSNND